MMHGHMNVKQFVSLSVLFKDDSNCQDIKLF